MLLLPPVGTVPRVAALAGSSGERKHALEAAAQTTNAIAIAYFM